ncbi:hypothetical protein K469DRAFT_740828 [Zopfia rhizophila CBS 207.26]|uniref:AAA+ ATPase domain-containing protein n=1 Tax=Zopfia rhizophila CBS 207.26 TaxID=1314779 RepID=A0A6A6DT69_9PEZI|nr:hypothetical protein K469DRAFT_740828 [Zopfia rhizophila CBS 207.26]
MEPAGLAVGFAGLAGLFSTCVDCFKLVQVYDSRSSDYGILQTMLDNQQFHFMAWGKACGFMDPDRTNSRFDDPMSGLRNERIEETMERIKSLLTNGDNLKEKYGLKVQRAPIGSKFIEDAALSAFSRAFQSTKAFRNTSLQRKSQITGSIRWAVNDRDKFDRLVQNLRDLLDDLTKLAEDIGVTDSQRLIVEYEMEMIDDEPSLEAITAASACDGDDGMLSQAATRRLKVVKEQSMANQSVRFDDSVSMISFQRYTPSVSTLIGGEEDGVVQEIGITRVPLSEWRKMKTRAGIVPWLKVLVIATSSSTSVSEMRDYIRPLSRANTLDGNAETTVQERPLRLAINSQTLLSTLRKITAYNFSPKHNVLVYPFKPLLIYYNSLRNYFTGTREKLEMLRGPTDTQTTDMAVEWNSNKSKVAPEGTAGEPSGAEPEKTKRVLEELECLMDFIDNDMRELLEIRKQIGEKTLQKIFFEHLRLLFQPGVIVISPDPNTSYKLRAYQVLHVTGGRPIIDADNYSKSEGPDSLDNWDYNNQEGYAVISSRQCTDFVVDCFYMDFNGEKYGPRPQRFVISEFTGERDISSLPIYPPTKAQIDDGILERLRARGKEFVHCAAGKRHLYNGPILQEWDPGHRDTCASCARSYVVQEQRGSEIVIDHIAALEHCRNSGCTWNLSFGGGVIAKATKANRREAFETVDCLIPNCRTCTDVFNDAVIDLNSRDRFIRSSKSLRALHQKQLDDEQVLLLPYRICGYSLQSRKWYPLYVDLLKPIEVSSAGLADLILPAGHKDMLASVIRGQSPGVSQTDNDALEEVDIVVGRGRGALILLHGARGTGKTATAEALAASLNRPLFLIKIADLGSTSREMEQNLTQFFQLAERWGCILLMREADALLEQRTRTDREGNNMTSVFLDALEYFSGILILTTNRIGAFDEAIMSRLHLSLYYPTLGMNATRELWYMNLRRLDHHPRLEVDKSGILEFLEDMYERHKWNGRQIRNMVDTAVAIAHEDAKRSNKETVLLSSRHLEVVLKSSREFSEYLSTVHGADEAERTRIAGRRMDQFRPQSPVHSVAPLSWRYKDPHTVRPGARAFAGPSFDEPVAGSFVPSNVEDDDLEIQELELQLQMAKLKKKQKALQAQKM